MVWTINFHSTKNTVYEFLVQSTKKFGESHKGIFTISVQNTEYHYSQERNRCLYLKTLLIYGCVDALCQNVFYFSPVKTPPRKRAKVRISGGKIITGQTSLSSPKKFLFVNLLELIYEKKQDRKLHSIFVSNLELGSG